jgi:uncharacterized protein YwqG
LKEETTNCLKDRLENIGLCKFSKAIASAALMGIRLSPTLEDENKMKLSESKVGGMPDLPQLFEWPLWKDQSLSFIAQINLGEVSNFYCAETSPKRGILYFFYSAEQETWGFDPADNGSWRTLYYDGPMEGLERRNPPDDLPEYAIYDCSRLAASELLTLPPADSITMESLALMPAERDSYFDFVENFYEEDNGCKHQLFGHPATLQGDMQLECQLVSHGLYCGDPTGYTDPRAQALKEGSAEWQLLLQVDTDDSSGMMWGDCGRLYYWIKKTDLLKCNFEDVWMILQCG